MPFNLVAEARRVSTNFAQEVKTPIGEVFVTYSPKLREVTVSFHPRNGDARPVFSGGKEPEMAVTVGKRPPAVGDEVTQGGKTHEVRAVRYDEASRKYWIQSDGGTWEPWEE